MIMIKKLLFAVILFFSVSRLMQPTGQIPEYLTPNGTGGGTSWSDATTIANGVAPAGGWQCGYNYYLAGGTYTVGSTTSAAYQTIANNCPASSPLNIYKATSSNSGSVTGWQSSYANQSLFQQSAGSDPYTTLYGFFVLSGSNITIDGVVPSLTAPCKADGGATAHSCSSGAFYGIHLQSPNQMSIGYFIESTGAGNSVYHVEFDGVVNPYGYQVATDGCVNNGNGTATVILNGTVGSPQPFNWVTGDNVVIAGPGTGIGAFSTSTSGARVTVGGTASAPTLTYTPASMGSATSCTGGGTATAALGFNGSGALEMDPSVPTGFNFTAQYNYIHDLAHPLHLMTAIQGLTFWDNYVARNHVAYGWHANFLDGASCLNCSIGFNILEDISGTALLTPTNRNIPMASASFCTVAAVSGNTATLSGTGCATMTANGEVGLWVQDYPPSPAVPNVVNGLPQFNGSGGLITANTKNSVTAVISGTYNSYFSVNDQVKVYETWDNDVFFSNLDFCSPASFTSGVPNLDESWESPQCFQSQLLTANDHYGVMNLDILGNTFDVPNTLSPCSFQFVSGTIASAFGSSIIAENNLCVGSGAKMVLATSGTTTTNNSVYGTSYSNQPNMTVPGTFTTTGISGGGLGAQSGYIIITWVDIYGHVSLGSAEQTYSIGSGNLLKVTPGTAPASAFGWLPPFIGATSGSETVQSVKYCTNAGTPPYKLPNDTNNVTPVCALTSAWTEPTTGFTTTGKAISYYKGNTLGTGNWLAYWKTGAPNLFANLANENYVPAAASDANVYDQNTAYNGGLGLLCSETYGTCDDDLAAYPSPYNTAPYTQDMFGNTLNVRGAFAFETPARSQSTPAPQSHGQKSQRAAR
jgi:hypothetical protein